MQALYQGLEQLAGHMEVQLEMHVNGAPFARSFMLSDCDLARVSCSSWVFCVFPKTTTKSEVRQVSEAPFARSCMLSDCTSRAVSCHLDICKKTSDNEEAIACKPSEHVMTAISPTSHLAVCLAD